MKRIAVFIFLLSVRVYSFAQNDTAVNAPMEITPQQWDQLKAEGKLNTGLYVMKQGQDPQPLKTIVQPPSTNPQTVPANCNCMIPIDATFQVVPFQFGTAPDYRNDDGSSPVINLPFVFCFYGNVQSQVYINNNGNISFGSPYGTFSASAFPSSFYTMIAPFWADVDTRNLTSGIVYYKVTPTALIVHWQNVGYYSQHVDKLNDFQLIITDGTDPLLPPGSNCGFCYGDMQWTTGDASGGSNGFGGTAATVGANMGDGVNYIQIGTFDQAGTTYNGPFGPPSQISWLDNKQFFLDVCSTGGGGNLPPIMNAALVCDTLTLCVGDTLPITAQFLSPENNQTTTITASTPGTGLTTLVSTPGNPASFNAIFVGMTSNIGLNTVTLSGTDNGTPPQTTNGNVLINVIAGPTASFTSAGVCPGLPMQFNDASTTVNGPITSYHWDFGLPAQTNDTSDIQSPQWVYNTPGAYPVTLTVIDSLGCKDTAIVNAQVFYLPQVQFSGGPLIGCAPLCVDLADQSTVQNSVPAHWNWQYPDGGSDTIPDPNHCFANQGDYSVVLTVTSQQGCSYTDSIHNYIHVIPGPQAAFSLTPQPATMSDPTIYFTDQSTAGPQEWYWDFGVSGANSTSQNPNYVYPDTGSYNVMLVVSAAGGACPDTAWATLTISPELLIWIPNAFTPNGNDRNDVFTPVFSDVTYVNQYDFMVFDRWGNLVFHSQDPYKGWDGRLNDQYVMSDTYVYKIFVGGIDGTTHSYIGSVSVIR
ncbi:MAG TPA: PKD domain-containing protein [Bacteroidia bacterium]|nr:PKD domain-containing protein [Bacteroidia bacterium]